MTTYGLQMMDDYLSEAGLTYVGTTGANSCQGQRFAWSRINRLIFWNLFTSVKEFVKMEVVK